MKNIVILGVGAAGILVTNTLSHRLELNPWAIAFIGYSGLNARSVSG